MTTTRAKTVVVALAMLASADACAVSSVGDARVEVVDDQPCFSASGGSKRDASLRVHGLTVTQGERTDWRSSPKIMWGFSIDDPAGFLVDATPGCIRYGRLPPAASPRGPALPLQPSVPYRVEINARRADGRDATLGYEIRFCVKPLPNGTTEVRTVAWDETARRWRTEACPGVGTPP